MKRNGKASEKVYKVEVGESINRMEELKEAMCEQHKIGGFSSAAKFYTQEGSEVTDDTLCLVKSNDSLYFDPSGGCFDQSNIFEQYTMLEGLGQGGFGSVRKAQHKETKQFVAIKHMDITECSK